MKLFDVLQEDLVKEKEVITKKSHKIDGLTSLKAEQLLLENGFNELKSNKKMNKGAIFVNQYKDIMTLILLACTIISLFMGEYVEAVAITVIVLMNGILGFIQEYRTEKTLEALKNMASPVATVLRDGAILKIESKKIVQGDVVLIESGNKIPADGKLLSSTSLECDESMLTGESICVKKNLDSTKDEHKNVYMGCMVAKGYGRFLVTNTGMKTKMGQIAQILESIKDEQTPLQKRLGQLSKYIAFGCILICLVVSVAGIIRGEDFLSMLITGVSLAVAAVPEGLPAIVTISLALSVSKMVKRKALVRRLHAVETLGCANIICSDKTGTLTQNKMTATHIYDGRHMKSDNLDINNIHHKMILHGITLCNNGILGTAQTPNFGEHTELALLNLSKKYNITRDVLAISQKRIAENPFDSQRKRMSVIVQDEHNDKIQFVKGGFDIILDRCTEYQDGYEIKQLSPKDKIRLLKESEKMTDKALRVIGIAYKLINSFNTGVNEDSLIFLGFIGIIDPPRKEVRPAVKLCHKAGIRTIMITGDHKNTAVAIAKQVGIFEANSIAMTGAEIDSLSDNDFMRKIKNVSVFARVTPSHKLKIVKSLKLGGNVVAMTGDGVNDAPAIKEADIGVAMGITGTDVTKEASEIILLDDNFATLINAIEEGRGIYSNIRKFIRYLLACNIGEVITMFFGMLMGMPVILFPIQILLVNLVTDGLPAIALGLEPTQKGIMSNPPRQSGESIFSDGLSFKIVSRGFLIGISTLGAFVTLFNITGSIDIARTGAFFGLVFAQLIHVFECKSEDKHIFKINYFNNKKLIMASLLSLIVLLIAVYAPFAQNIFSTVPLSFSHVVIPILYSFVGPLINVFILSGNKD